MTVTALSEGGAFPSRRQELLLKAALFQGQTALEAWGTWKAEFDLEKRLDAGSYRLLPLLYHNLARHGVDEPVMGKLKGIYRRAWYLNQTLFRDGVSVLRSLHAAGIETAVLKGAALSLLCYKDPGLRPMDDFDVLVPNRKRRLAIEMLQRDGWTSFGASFESLTEAALDIRHSCGFRNANGRDVDLHWRILSPYLAYPADEDDFWAGAVVLQIMGEPTLALNSTDNLLHTCVHATNWQPVHPMRWISDAMIILRTAPTGVDWARLVAMAEKRQVILQVREALLYLARVFGAAVPSDVLDELKAMRVSEVERKHYLVLTKRPGLLGSLPLRWYQYRLQAEIPRRRNPMARLLGFIRHVQRTENMSPRRLLTWVASRTAGRLGAWAVQKKTA